MQLNKLKGVVLDGKYRIETQLGEGGMGAVFLAKHLGTKRSVALKVIMPRMTSSEMFIERFKREAEAAGSLRHPNVVDVTDFGFAIVGAEEIAYLVMEYLDGCTLAEILAEEKSLPLKWAVDILDQTCLAVEEAHQKGIIHRDLKPGNIWIEPNRRGGYSVKVLDFGLAKIKEVSWNEASFFEGSFLGGDAEDQGPRTFAYEDRPDARAATVMGSSDSLAGIDPSSSEHMPIRHDFTPSSEELTQVGTVVGTPQYMSPEQCRAMPLDPRADIYSLGIIAYEMLAGSRPFDGEPLSLMLKHVTEKPVPLHERCPAIPKTVSNLILAALEKEPSARPQSAAVFASTLRAAAETPGSLFQGAVSLCIANFPIFVRLFLIAYAPLIYVRLIWLIVSLQAFTFPLAFSLVWIIGFGVVVSSIARFLGSSITRGVSALLLTQMIRTPLASLRFQSAIDVMRRRRRDLFIGSLFYVVLLTLPFYIFQTTIGQSLMAFVYGLEQGLSVESVVVSLALGTVGVVAGYIAFRNIVTYSLFPIVLLVEGLPVRDSLKRSSDLVSRARESVIPAGIAEMLVMAVILVYTFVVRAMVASYIGHEIAIFLFSTIVDFFANSIIAVLYAMLYVNLRQLGGESLDAMLDNQYVQQDIPRAKWMERMQTRSHSRRRTTAKRLAETAKQDG